MTLHTNNAQGKRPHVVVIGGGFAGQAIACELRKSDVDITLIDKNNYMTFQPLLYQVATAGLEPEEIVYPIRAVFKNQQNFRFRLGKVVGVDWHQKRVHLQGQMPLTFDYLVFAAGSAPDYFNISGAQRHCFPLKQLSDAVTLRSHILKQFEMVDQNPELLKQGLLNFVVIGGGPTGVEMAGALVELFQNTLKNDYPELPLEKARVIMIEAGPTLLRPFNEASQRHAEEVLQDRGVHLVKEERVTEVARGAVLLSSNRSIRTATPIWAVGVKASPLAGLLQLEQTRGGRIVVNKNLSVPGKPNVYVVGDMAGSQDAEGNLHPQLASVARQGAKHAAREIKAQLKGQASTAFEYKNPGIMATVGRHAAVAEFPGEIRLEGFFAWLTWLFLHLVLLTGIHNRAHVLVSWLCTYCTKDRSARLILEEDIAEVETTPLHATRPDKGITNQGTQSTRQQAAQSTRQQAAHAVGDHRAALLKINGILANAEKGRVTANGGAV